MCWVYLDGLFCLYHFVACLPAFTPTPIQVSYQHYIDSITNIMCGTESSRPVLGGTIAILKSLTESPLPDLSLLFHQTSASTTTATFSSEATTDAELSSCQIVILYVCFLSPPLSRPRSKTLTANKTVAMEISELKAQ
jgi:hypothetical protein